MRSEKGRSTVGIVLLLFFVVLVGQTWMVMTSKPMPGEMRIKEGAPPRLESPPPVSEDSASLWLDQMAEMYSRTTRTHADTLFLKRVSQYDPTLRSIADSLFK